MGLSASRKHAPALWAQPLAQAIAETKARAKVAGLTGVDIDAELTAYNSERRRELMAKAAHQPVQVYSNPLSAHGELALHAAASAE